MTKTTIVVELDGVLADNSARADLMSVDWDTWHRACDTDKPNDALIQVLRSLSETGGYEVLIVTGRPARFDKITIDWLNRYNVPADEILMRPEMDYRDEVSVKLDLLAEYFGSLETALENVVVGFEAKDKIIDGLRLAGFEVWSLR